MITQELREEMIERFINNVLPHGSGIDCDWRVMGTGFENYYSQGKIGKDNSKYVYFNNSYHCMDENGYYDGYQDFSVRMDKTMFFAMIDAACHADTYMHEESKRNMQERVRVLADILSETFVLQFTNGQYKSEKYQLRDYLEDTLAWDIRSAHIRMEIS